MITDNMTGDQKLFTVFWICVAFVLISVVAGITFYQYQSLKHSSPTQTIRLKVELEKDNP